MKYEDKTKRLSISIIILCNDLFDMDWFYTDAKLPLSFFCWLFLICLLFRFDETTQRRD